MKPGQPSLEGGIEEKREEGEGERMWGRERQEVCCKCCNCTIRHADMWQRSQKLKIRLFRVHYIWSRLLIMIFLM